jgi:hypothetical protein
MVVKFLKESELYSIHTRKFDTYIFSLFHVIVGGR